MLVAIEKKAKSSQFLIEALTMHLSTCELFDYVIVDFNY